jgi:DNA-binding protein H-NS
MNTSPVKKPASEHHLPDISALSEEDLVALVAAAQGELTARRERKKQEFLGSFREAIAAAGLSPAEVAAALGRRSGGGNAGRRAHVQPKYRNPANPSETWSGRGKQPKWLEAQLASGKKIEDLKISA